MAKPVSVFLVEVDAAVYDNDTNFIVVAETALEAECIVKTKRPYICINAKHITVTELKSDRGSTGVIHEYSPHAGDPNLGD